MLDMERMRFPLDVIAVCIGWYAAYQLSYHYLEEMMQECGVVVDHSSIGRWAIRFLPLLEKAFRKQKRQAGGSWRMDETYIKIKRQWKCLYRAVDKEGKAIHFQLTANRNKAATMRFYEKATMDKSGANKSAIDQIIEDKNISVVVRQVKYLNNMVEQDHRAVKLITKPILAFKSFHAAKNV